MKDIKTKDKSEILQNSVVKNKPKTISGLKTVPQDIKAVVKDQYIRQKSEMRDQLNQQSQESERPENSAVSKVENTAQAAADLTYQKAKHYTENKLKKRKSDVKTAQHSEATAEAVTPAQQPAPKMRMPDEQMKVRTRQPPEVKTQSTPSVAKPTAAPKTKAEFIKQNASAHTEAPRQKPAPQRIKANSYQPKTKESMELQEAAGDAAASTAPKTSTVQVRREYVKKKLETKAERENRAACSSEVPKPPADQPAFGIQTESSQDNIWREKSKIKAKQQAAAKTKDTYMDTHSLNRRVVPDRTPAHMASQEKSVKVADHSRGSRIVPKVQKDAPQELHRLKAHSMKHTRPVHKVNLPKTAQAVNKTTKATAKSAARKQNQATKQAMKQAAKRSTQLAKQSAQAAKKAAKTTARVTVKVARAVVAVARAVLSALLAMGGWGILLIALIVVIVVAAIAGSPFGIFLTEEADDPENIPVSSIIAEVNIDFSQRLEAIETGGQYSRVETTGAEPSWDEVLAVFAVKIAGTDDETAQDVVIIDEAKKEKLIEVYWDMVQIESHVETSARPPEGGDPNAPPTEEKVLYINIVSKTAEDMIGVYNFSERQQEALKTLLENNEVLIGASQSLAVSDGTAQDVLKNLPKSLPQKRKDVVKAACSLVGKVNYFWGGKSSAIGWDSEWGKMRRVSAAGSSSSGTVRPFGLDCSGFVTWAFHNSNMAESAIGHGTQGQVAKCTRISWSQAQAGDLAFYGNLSHVGIVVGKDASSNILVCHCSSGRNNVVITTNAGFGFAARPLCY